MSCETEENSREVTYCVIRAVVGPRRATQGLPEHREQALDVLVLHGGFLASQEQILNDHRHLLESERDWICDNRTSLSLSSMR